MDGLAFIAALVASLSWPVAVIILALAFREPIGRMVERLPKRVKAGPIEVEWPEIATEARVALATSPEAERAAGGESLTDRLAPIADKAPEAAILAAYGEVERALRVKFEKAGWPDAPSGGIRTLARQVARQALSAHSRDGCGRGRSRLVLRGDRGTLGLSDA